MNILYVIASYGNYHRKYLERIIDELKSYKEHSITIIIDATDKKMCDDLAKKYKNLKMFLHESDIGVNLTWVHRRHFLNYLNRYDLYIYSEDDMMITEKNVNTFIKYDSIIPPNALLGFIRYEAKDDEDANKYLTELDTKYKTLLWDTNIECNNKKYFTMSNPHQACYCITNEKLKFALMSEAFDMKSKTTTGIVMEQAASSIFTSASYFDGIFHKLLPKNIDDLNNCLIHHMPNNYINKPDGNIGTLWTFEKLKKHIKNI